MTTASSTRTDARPVREHILDLYAADFTDRRIASITGLAPETISTFTKPLTRTSNRRSIKRWCHPSVAEAILAVNIDGETPGCVNATGSHRRIQALVTRGWPIEAIAHRVGISGRHLRLIMSRARIYGRTAQAIARIYDELKSLNPERHGVAPWEADKARKRGKAKRWPTPAYWADRMDVIDDPHFEPMHDVTRRLIIAQDANWVMRTAGLDRGSAAKRLGVSRDYIDHAFQDHPEYAVGVAA